MLLRVFDHCAPSACAFTGGQFLCWQAFQFFPISANIGKSKAIFAKKQPNSLAIPRERRNFAAHTTP